MSCAGNRIATLLLIAAGTLLVFAIHAPAVIAQTSSSPEIVAPPQKPSSESAPDASGDEKEKKRRHAFRMWAIVSLALLLLLIVIVIILLLSGRRLRWRILGHDRKVTFSKMEDLWWHKPDEDEGRQDERDKGKEGKR